MFVVGKHSCYVDNNRQTGKTFLVSLAPSTKLWNGWETSRSKALRLIHPAHAHRKPTLRENRFEDKPGSQASAPLLTGWCFGSLTAGARDSAPLPLRCARQRSLN